MHGPGGVYIGSACAIFWVVRFLLTRHRSRRY
jgi:hypothetical protein